MQFKKLRYVLYLSNFALNYSNIEIIFNRQQTQMFTKFKNLNLSIQFSIC